MDKESESQKILPLSLLEKGHSQKQERQADQSGAQLEGSWLVYPAAYLLKKKSYQQEGRQWNKQYLPWPSPATFRTFTSGFKMWYVVIAWKNQLLEIIFKTSNPYRNTNQSPAGERKEDPKPTWPFTSKNPKVFRLGGSSKQAFSLWITVNACASSAEVTSQR